MDNPFWFHIFVQITDHCNKKCSHCSTYATISEPWEYDLEKLQNDVNKIRYLLKDGPIRNIRWNVTGGEPMFHSKIKEIKSIFDNDNIEFNTGIKLEKDFLDTFDNQRIFYSLHREEDSKIDFIFNENNMFYVNSYMEKNHNMFYKNDIKIVNALPFKRIVLDISGKSTKNNFNTNDNSCFMTIRDGKLYHCSYAANCFKLEKKYGVHFDLIEGQDYLVINSIQDVQTFLDFYNNPTPFCKHCVKEGNISCTQKEPEASDWLVI